MTNKNAALDFTAISLSALCIIHCLALPFLIAALPVMGVFAGPAVHKALVLLALPITAFAIFRSFSSPGGMLFTVGALCGLGLLVAGAFVEALHDYEVTLTVIGAIVLVLSHLWRLRMGLAASNKATAT